MLILIPKRLMFVLQCFNVVQNVGLQSHRNYLNHFDLIYQMKALSYLMTLIFLSTRDACPQY